MVDLFFYVPYYRYMHYFSGTKLTALDEETQRNLFIDLKRFGAAKTSKKYCKELGFKEKNLYNALYRESKSLENYPDLSEADVGPRELTKEEEALIQKYEQGEIGFDAMQRLLSAQMFKKLLQGESDIKASDWLRSEQVRLKKDQVDKTKDAQEQFIDALFSGFLPALKCPNCGEDTVIPRERLGSDARILSTTRKNSAK